ncbi:MAG: hypothetical protein IJV26_02920 [Lachnospiraceae bacterium]|nr:hypothetical protein [Lachnospiraceae bacterium]
MKAIINNIRRIVRNIAAAFNYSNFLQTKYMVDEARRGHWMALCGASGYTTAMAAM